MRSTRAQVLATLVAVLVIGAIVALASLGGSEEGSSRPSEAQAPGASEAFGPPGVGTSSGVSDDQAAAERANADVLGSRPAPAGARELAELAEKLAGEPLSFRITTFNILGSNHTVPGGTRPNYASGRIRTQWAADLLRGYGSDIVGFQELQGDQLAGLQAVLADDYEFYTPPGTGTTQTTLIWRKGAWSVEWARPLTSRFMGGLRTRPMVLLRHRDSGREVYVVNVHNSPGRLQAQRDEARNLQVAAVNELRTDGRPILFLGDMNERERVCNDFAARADLRSSRGSCTGRMRVDWVFGSSEVRFTSHVEDRSPAVARITDHAVITAGVTLP